MKSLALLSPAKLNLFLKVLNKRSDGYHNLDTIFERIDLCDQLVFTPNPSGKIRVFCDHADVPTDNNNLVYKAAQLLKDDFSLSDGVDIKIIKKIPVAAGLGGGSSNAAIALLGLNQIWKLRLNKTELLDYAKRLGSDVPFFLYDCSWARGSARGDDIQKLNIHTRLWHVLVVPSVKMYSKDVFSALNLELTKPNDDVNILIHSLKKNDLTTVGRLIINDLERAILKLRPELLKSKNEVRGENIKAVSFSGSGPAIFGITATQQEAEALKLKLDKYYTQVFTVRTF